MWTLVAQTVEQLLHLTGLFWGKGDVNLNLNKSLYIVISDMSYFLVVVDWRYGLSSLQKKKKKKKENRRIKEKKLKL